MVPYHDCVPGFNSYTINYGFRRRPTLKEASELLLHKHSTLFFHVLSPLTIFHSQSKLSIAVKNF